MVVLDDLAGRVELPEVAVVDTPRSDWMKTGSTLAFWAFEFLGKDISADQTAQEGPVDEAVQAGSCRVALMLLT